MSDQNQPQAKAVPDHIMQFFDYRHLPSFLSEVSRPFCELAQEMHARLRRSPERTVMLRKLLEAKDAAVRAAIAVEDRVP